MKIAAEADRTLHILMGDKVAPRREFIEAHAPNDFAQARHLMDLRFCHWVLGLALTLQAALPAGR